ncbi:MAG: FAD-dependent oxidoreductase [Deltaproteobacteria bacterium]|nr:FAD-dependent oxidoreductase [Deltaproteobacteria bacterium]
MEFKHDVAIIGAGLAGPAGLAAAHDLSHMGLSVTIFEAQKEPGGMLRYGIPEFRLPRKILSREIEEILGLGVLLKTETNIGRDIALSELMKGHEAVLLAIGCYETLSRADRVLIIGGDLISLAFTRALLHMGKEVLFMLNEEAFWPVRFTEALYDEVADRLSSLGTKPLRYRKFRGMTELTDRTIEVCLEGQVIETEVIGAFFGLVPDVAFLAGSGFALDRGLLVDETLGTGHDGIYAAGDCAQVYHPDLCDYWVSIGYSNALTLGRIAALNVLGEGLEARTCRSGIFDLQGVKANTSWWTEL